jgi:hypothetical protein
MVVDISGLHQITAFSELPPLGMKDIEGRFILHTLDTAGKPILQMTILVYKDGRRECLLGWDIGGNKTAQMPVLLFRYGDKTTVVDYFINLFQHYQTCGTPVRTKEQFDALLRKSQVGTNPLTILI